MRLVDLKDDLLDYFRYDFKVPPLRKFVPIIPLLAIGVVLLVPLDKEQEELVDKGKGEYTEVELAIEFAKLYKNQPYVIAGNHGESYREVGDYSKKIQTDTSSFVRLAYATVGLDLGEGTTITYAEEFGSYGVPIDEASRGDLIIDKNKMGICLDNKSYIGNIGSDYGNRSTDGVQIASIDQSRFSEDAIVVPIETLAQNGFFKVDKEAFESAESRFFTVKEYDSLLNITESKLEVTYEEKAITEDGYYLFMINSPEISKYAELFTEYSKDVQAYPVYYYDMSDTNKEGIELGESTYKLLTETDFEMYSSYPVVFVKDGKVSFGNQLLLTDNEKSARFEELGDFSDIFIYQLKDLEVKGGNEQ